MDLSELLLLESSAQTSPSDCSELEFISATIAGQEKRIIHHISLLSTFLSLTIEKMPSILDTEQMGGSYRKKRRVSRYEHYVSGAGRGVYKLRSQDLENALELSPTLEGVCSFCASGLAGIAHGFFKLKQQGTELKIYTQRAMA